MKSADLWKFVKSLNDEPFEIGDEAMDNQLTFRKKKVGHCT